MPANLATKAVEKSTYVVTVAFEDAAGAAVVPDSINWTLTDADGNIINNRDSTSIAIPAASVDIVLSGNDLACPHGRDRAMILTVEAVYDSTEGEDLPLRDQIRFTVQNLKAVQ